VLNATPEDFDFTIPACACRPLWSILVDTSRPETPAEQISGQPAVVKVNGRSLVLLSGDTTTAPPESATP
jgi:hypothetical protein